MSAPVQSCGPDISVGIATELPGWTVRESNPGGGEIFRTCPDRPCGPPCLLYNEYRVFPGVTSARGVALTPHPFLVPWSRKSRAIPLHPLWAVRPVQSRSGCTVELYLYSPYGPYGLYRASVPLQGCTLPLPYLCKGIPFQSIRIYP